MVGGVVGDIFVTSGINFFHRRLEGLDDETVIYVAEKKKWL